MTKNNVQRLVAVCLLITLMLAIMPSIENSFAASSEEPSAGIPADLPADLPSDLSDEAIQQYIKELIAQYTGGDPANLDYTELGKYKEQIKSMIDMAKLLAIANGINPYDYPDVLTALDQFQEAIAKQDATSQEIEDAIKQVATAATTSGLTAKVAEVIKAIRDAQVKAGDIVTAGGSKYVVLSADAPAFNFGAMTGTPSTSVNGTGAGTVALKAAKNVKSFKVPATVKLSDGKAYKVVQVNAKAFTGKKIKTVTVSKNVKKLAKNTFAKSKATKLILKTKLLKKATVKGCLKGSKIKTIQIKVGSKKVNKKYKKIFNKKNAGKKVTVK